MSETTNTNTTPAIRITQIVAILIDGNNIERSLHKITDSSSSMLNFDGLIPKLLRGRGLSRLIYFREGKAISSKLANRLLENYHGTVIPCHKSADIPLTISATQIASKVDTIIILSGDSDYVELVRHLKGEGVRVEIAAIPDTTASILVDEADHFIPITKEDSFSMQPSNKSYKKTYPRKPVPLSKPSQSRPVQEEKKEEQRQPISRTRPVRKSTPNEIKKEEQRQPVSRKKPVRKVATEEVNQSKDIKPREQPKPVPKKRTYTKRKPTNKSKMDDDNVTVVKMKSKTVTKEKEIPAKKEQSSAPKKRNYRRKSTTTAKSTQSGSKIEAEKKKSSTPSRRRPTRRTTKKED